MIEDLFQALREADADAGPEELADILWLATRVGGAEHTDVRPGPDAGEEPEPLDPPEFPVPGPQEAEPAPEEGFYSAADVTDAPGPSRDGIDLVRVRRASFLRDPLALMRALRPVGRSTGGRAPEHRVAHLELDEELTVRRTVEQRLPVPVLRPRKARWLELALVVDAHHSMLLWHDLVAELRRVFVQTGIFRDVRVWHLRGTGESGPLSVSRTPDGERRHVQEVSDPSGNRLVLIVTDTVASGWAGDKVAAMLRQWSAHGPVALLNVLPRRLWDRGAVRPRALRIRSVGPAAPNASWRQSPATARPRRRRRAEPKGIAVPVVEATAESVSVLAKVVAGDGQWKRVHCLTVPQSAPTPPRAEEEPVAEGVEAILRRFRAGASPAAQQLAGYLSAVPLSLPVMNLVRQVMLPDSEHGHLAEVALGGLLKPWADADATDPDSVPFDFRPGVRAALLGGQRRDAITSVQEVVRREMGAGVSERGAVSGGDFLAGRTAEGEGGRWGVAGEAVPFAVRPSRTAEAAEAAEPLWQRVAELAELVPADYVERAVDEQLREVTDRALEGQSSCTVLIGRRGAGKTAAVARAVGRLPDDWTLWVPRGPEEMESGLPLLPDRSVVLLDQPLLFGLSYFRSLVPPRKSGPVLVFAEVTEDAVDSLPKDPYLNLVRLDSPAWGSDVLRRIQEAPPVVRALLRAALDIQRLGHAPAMPHELLTAATRLYVPEDAHEEPLGRPLSAALEHACRASDSGEQPFMFREPQRRRYLLSDFVRRAVEAHTPFVDPPEALWQVLTQHADHDSLPALARSARRRGRPEAALQLGTAHAFYDVYDPSPRSAAIIGELVKDAEQRLVQVRNNRGDLLGSGICLSDDGLVVTAFAGLSASDLNRVLRVRPHRSNHVAAARLLTSPVQSDLCYLVMHPRAPRPGVTTLSATSMPHPGQDVLVVGLDSQRGLELTVLRCRVDPLTSDTYDLVRLAPNPWPAPGAAVVDLQGQVIGAVCIADESSRPRRLIGSPITPPGSTAVRSVEFSAPPGLIDPDRSRALVAGTDVYQHADLPNLPGAGDAASELAFALGRGQEGGVFRSHNVEAAWNDTSREMFLERLSHTLRQAGHTFLLAYAGHLIETPDDAFLTFPDTDPEHPLRTAVSIRELRSMLDGCPAQVKVLLLDTCAEDPYRTWSWFEPLSPNQNGWVLLTSVRRRGHKPLEMTRAITRALAAGDPGGPDYLPLTDLLGPRMKTVAVFRRGGPVPLVRNPAFVPGSAAEHDGTVKWFSSEKGYGFITLDDGREIFVHYSAIDMHGYRTLQEGQRVRLTIIENSKGLQASYVRPY
ncbi:SAV_2336 N-terminal domain-related protein [Streptomyces sp. GXMU-J15]|uniref:SAV_2336 N-terminal domain-related protein n=1 Tax=Streptomyces fuscus TaxID=3048495 RepID=A0ABT7J0T4_9ACTN|nr:SAV_2336 N-terminal domain-related protein [Streptomyces fuscus]MDL2078474.1 SAV_2336 N-terminal domain-related protein [Streptomyces fuscus]